MRNVSSAFKVGLVLLLALIGAAVLYRVVVQRAAGGGSYHVYAMFRDASGLVPRSRVQIAGIPVGIIDTIRLQDGMARVDMSINRDVPLYEDATVSRRSASLLGEYLLVMAPGATGGRRVHEGDRVRVLQEGTSTDDILNNVNGITLRVREVTDRVANVFGTEEGQREMADALRNLTETTAELNRTVHGNSEAITHAIHNVDAITTEGRPEVRSILENVNDATHRVDRIVADNQSGVNDTLANVDEAVRNANAASRDLREALAHVNNITAGVDRGEGTAGRLVRDDTLIDEAEGVAAGVNDFVEPLSRLQTIVGLRSEYNFISGSLKSYIELRLQPREDRYILFQLVDDNRGLTTRQRTIYTSTNPNDPHTWTVTQQTTQDSLRFTLQFARRVGPATFRFGLMESTGGIGADLHFFNDRFEIQSDLFDFSVATLPRLRFALAFEFMRHAWLQAGVDDVLNPDRFDVFGGAMLRFNDEDLRGILLFAGGLLSGATSRR